MDILNTIYNSHTSSRCSRDAPLLWSRLKYLDGLIDMKSGTHIYVPLRIDCNNLQYSDFSSGVIIRSKHHQ